ncbi:MAG: SusE domain-containing protein [Ginsengibacter sp.]
MKKISKIFFLIALPALTIWSCKKDENKIYFEGGTAPVLSSSVSGTIALSNANKDNEAVKLSWTNPAYQFTTGISSQDVTYQLEIDTTGANFTSLKRQIISVSKNLSISFTQNQFNNYLLNQLQLTPVDTHNLEIRVTSFLANSSEPLSSNVLKFTVAPYTIPPAVTPPSSGALFITGNATPGNWQCACGEPELLSQKFTQMSPTLYVLPSIALSGGNSYTFIPVYGSWGVKYSIKTKNDPAEIYGGDFQVGGADILAPPVSGNYKIEVDFQRGKFTVTKL